MRHVFYSKKTLLFLALLPVFIVAAARQLPAHKQSNSQQQNNTTVDADSSEPRADNNLGNMKDFDKSMKELDLQMKNLDEQIKKIDYEEIEKAKEQAMKNIDWEKINAQTEKAMQEAKREIAKIDYEKITKDAMKNIDMEKMKENIQASMKTAQDEIAKINTQEIQEKLNEVQEKMNSEEFKQQMKVDVDKAMQGAKTAMEYAQVEMQNWKDFSGALQKDGLIDTSKAYSIELKDGVLFINGKEQSKETTEKYKKYYSGRDNFTINMNGENDDAKEKDEQ